MARSSGCRARGRLEYSWAAARGRAAVRIRSSGRWPGDGRDQIHSICQRASPSAPGEGCRAGWRGRPAVGFSMESGGSYSSGRNLAADFESISPKQTKVTKEFPEPVPAPGGTTHSLSAIKEDSSNWWGEVRRIGGTQSEKESDRLAHSSDHAGHQRPGHRYETVAWKGVIPNNQRKDLRRGAASAFLSSAILPRESVVRISQFVWRWQTSLKFGAFG